VSRAIINGFKAIIAIVVGVVKGIIWLGKQMFGIQKKFADWLGITKAVGMALEGLSFIINSVADFFGFLNDSCVPGILPIFGKLGSRFGGFRHFDQLLDGRIEFDSEFLGELPSFHQITAQNFHRFSYRRP